MGSGIGFDDRGVVDLRGVPGTWELLAVARDGAPAGSVESELVSLPTPGRRATMRSSDVAVEALVRRTPWLIRGMARIAPITDRKAFRSPHRN